MRHTGQSLELKAKRNQLYKEELVDDMIKTMGAIKFGIGKNVDQENAKAIISSKRLSPGLSKSKADTLIEEMNNTFAGSWGFQYPDRNTKPTNCV